MFRLTETGAAANSSLPFKEMLYLAPAVIGGIGGQNVVHLL